MPENVFRVPKRRQKRLCLTLRWGGGSPGPTDRCANMHPKTYWLSTRHCSTRAEVASENSLAVSFRILSSDSDTTETKGQAKQDNYLPSLRNSQTLILVQ